MLLLTPLVLYASATSWDAGLQSNAWRQGQQALLDATAARQMRSSIIITQQQQEEEETAGAAAAGPLLPCVVPVATPPLPASLPAEIQETVTQVEKGLDKMFADSGATGGVAVLVYGDQVLTTHGYGTTRADETTVPTGDTIFRVGSISKVFTDLMLHRFDEEGDDISLFTPITQLAPEYKPAWPAGIKASPKGGSLRDLGSHKAGLARYSPCNFGDCNITLETALARIANWTLLFEPGSDNLMYSNTGFALLGRLLERHSAEPWESILTKLATTLGMPSTSGTTPQGADAKARIAYGYQAGQAIPLQELGFSNPAGGVYSTRCVCH